MIKNSLQSKVLIFAYKKGYRILKNGEVNSPYNKILTPIIHITGYVVFYLRYNKISKPVFYHKLQAYQKYGNKIFETDCVRHLDGDKLNNSFNNINIGTFRENQMDKSKEERVRCATIASHSFMMKYNAEEVENIKKYHNEVNSYKRTMEHFNISSKGTLHFILNNR